MKLPELLLHTAVKISVRLGIVTYKNHRLRVEYKRDISQKSGKAVCKIGHIISGIAVLLPGGKEKMLQIHALSRQL